MKLLEIQAAIGAAIVLLTAPCDAKHAHNLQQLDIIHKRHHHSRLHASPRAEIKEAGLEKRGTCAFPTNLGLVAVTPGEQNAGWAMSPDQPCTADSYCPYACPPGEVMNQWNPLATSYVYPLSMDGGLYCNSNGEIEYPFPGKALCVAGTGTVGAKNECDDDVAFCQTVLPGNEAMLISTNVASSSTVTVAVPSVSYWCSTASHFYINAPGVSTADACVWSDGSKPIGNWAPYVAGANTDASGITYAKIGWNPIYTGCELSNTLPTFGVKFECDGGDCNGMPCSIDPSVNGMGGVTSADQAVGAGGASFCVVTIPKGSTANIIVFPVGGSAASTKKATSTVASTSTTATPTSTAKATATSDTSKTSSSKSKASSTITSEAASSTIFFGTNTNTTAPYPTASNSPHILFQNSNATATGTSGDASTTADSTSPTDTSTSSSDAAASTTSKKSAAEGTTVSGSFLGLSILIIAAGFMF